MGNILSIGTTNPISRQPVMSQSDMTKAVTELDSKFVVVDNVVGDIMGYGNSVNNNFISSLSGAIGSLQKAQIDLPMGQEFSDYTDSFSPMNDSDFVLTLHPVGDVSVVDSSGTKYKRVDKGYAVNNNEYTIFGRRIVFNTKPSSVFTVTYRGVYPSIEGYRNVGYAPNIIPNPTLISNGSTDRAEITAEGGMSYLLSVKNTYKNSYGNVFSGQLKYTINEKLKQFISPTGAIECPKEHISLWKKFGDKFQKIDDAEIYIISENKYRFKTSLQIDAQNDILVISISNWTVSDTLDAILRHLISHRHSVEELGSQISHSELNGIRAERYKQGDRSYGQSIISGDDHPQYFNREGYIANNPGNFNNAIIGDVLIGSSSESNMYNNTASDSRKIFFGSTDSGSSLMFSSLFNGLKLFGAENGLKIETHSKANNPSTKFGTGLNIDGHKIYANGGVDKVSNGVIEHTDNVLVIEAEDGKAEIKSPSGSKADLTIGKLNSDGGNVYGEMNINKSGSIKIGDIVIKEGDDGSAIASSENSKVLNLDVKTKLGDANIEKLSPKLISMAEGSEIKFGSDKGMSIAPHGDAISVKGNMPLIVDGTGRSTGLSIKTGDLNPYSSIYSASESGGVSSESDHDTYVESGDGDVVLLKSTQKDQTEDSTEYVFAKTASTNQKRIDNLKSWPKSNLTAGNIDSYSINVKESSLTKRRGVNFHDSAAIYATGSDTECPPGWLVFESKNGAVFIDSRADAIDCQNIVYSEITTGSQKVFGSITVDKNIGVSGDVDVAGSISGSSIDISEAASVGSISVKDDAKFTGNTQFTESVSVSSQLAVGGSVNVANRITTNEIEVASRTILNGVTDINNNVNVDGDLNITKGIYAAGDVRTAGKLTAINILSESLTAYNFKVTEGITAQGSLNISGEINSTANINTDSDIIADGGKFSTQVKTKNLIAEGDAKIYGETYVVGRFQVEGDVLIGEGGSKFSVSSDAIFNNNKTTSIGNFEVIGETELKGAVNLVSDLTVGSSTTLSGNVNIEGALKSSSSGEFDSLRVTNQFRAGGDVSISGRASISDDAIIAGGLNVKGNSVIGSSDSLVVFDGKATFNRDVLISASMNISGDTTISGNTKVTGELAINSKATIEGELSASGNAVVNGILKTNGLESSGQAVFRNGIISERSITTRSISAEEISNFKGGVNVEGESRFNGGITTSPDVTSSFGTVNILTSVTQSNASSQNYFAGYTNFNKGIEISGQSLIKGRVILGSDDSGIVLDGNIIKLNGSTSLIKTTSATVDKITGGTSIVIQSSSVNSALTSKIGQVVTKKYTEIENVYVGDTQVNRGDMLCLGTLYVGNITTIETPGSSSNILSETTTPMNIVAARARYAP